MRSQGVSGRRGLVGMLKARPRMKRPEGGWGEEWAEASGAGFGLVWDGVPEKRGAHKR